MIVKANGEREPFMPEKLLGSLMRSGADKALSSDVVSEVEKGLLDGMRTAEIYREAFELLRERQESAARRYSLRRAVMDLGPSGFPFENFIEQIFKKKGFETKTREVVLGACVEHEVDVVAWNDDKLIMMEAKFHNELGVKSDLKVVLYIKARMDDLLPNIFLYGKERHVDEGWLITNTKFTSTAVHYAECKGLTLVGWNYPEKGNLQDMILEAKVHPITCLSSLSQTHKQSLLARGVVLCQTLAEEPEFLAQLPISDEERQKVLEEINSL